MDFSRNLVAKLLPDTEGAPLLRVVIYDKDASLDSADLRPCGHAELAGRLFQKAEASFVNAFKGKHKCDNCNETSDLWLCLSCLGCHCSREGKGHGLKHFSETGHCVILSLVSLNFWCYAHQVYLEHDFYPVLLPLYRKLHQLRHGEQPLRVSSSSLKSPALTSKQSNCPHVELCVNRQIPALPRPSSMSCTECGTFKETWVCLQCFECHCGRFSNRHMIDHSEQHQEGHDLCINCEDMSIWCFKCQEYLDTFRHPLLTVAFETLYKLKQDEVNLPLPEALTTSKRFQHDLDWLDDCFLLEGGLNEDLL